MTVLVVTRPQPQADQWVERLLAMGQPALALPLLRILPAPGHAEAVEQAWGAIAQKHYDLVMFVSPNAVLQFFAARPAGVAGWGAGVIAAATGPGTVKALRSVGVAESAIAAPADESAQFDAEALWQQHLVQHSWTDRRVLIVRGESGRDWLAETLRTHGARVDLIAAYRRLGPDWSEPAMQQAWEHVAAVPVAHAWLFSSSEAVRALAERLRAEGLPAAQFFAMTAVATHERIAETAYRSGFRDVRTSRPDPESILGILNRPLEST